MVHFLKFWLYNSLLLVNIIQADVSELWYVEEYDVLALALNGRMKVRRFKLAASKSETSEDHKVEGKA